MGYIATPYLKQNKKKGCLRRPTQPYHPVRFVIFLALTTPQGDTLLCSHPALTCLIPVIIPLSPNAHIDGSHLPRPIYLPMPLPLNIFLIYLAGKKLPSARPPDDGGPAPPCIPPSRLGSLGDGEAEPEYRRSGRPLCTYTGQTRDKGKGTEPWFWEMGLQMPGAGFSRPPCLGTQGNRGLYLP